MIKIYIIALILAIAAAAEAKDLQAKPLLIGATVASGIYLGLGQMGCEDKVFKIGASMIGALFINMAWTMGNDDHTDAFVSRFNSATVGTAVVLPITIFE